jgi:hypothetical protein
MAKKKQNPGEVPGTKRVVTTETVEELPAGGGELDLTGADESLSEDDDALSALAELAGGSEAKCEVRRTSPADFAGYCCSYALSEMSLDRLQAEWGGGKFSIRVRLASGAFKGSVNVQIAGRPKFREDTSQVVSPAAPQGPAIDIGAIVTAATAGTKAQVDMLQGLVTALINKPAPVPEKRPDVLEVITQLTPILRPEKSGGNDGDAVKLLLQGIELGKEFAGGAGGGDDFTNLALKGMDMVKTVAAQTPPRRLRPVQPPARQLPPPGTVAAADAAPPPAKQEMPPMLKLLNWLKQQTQLLVHQAKRKKSPSLYAELFLDNMPEGVTLETLHEKLSADTYLQDLAEVTGNAEVLHHAAWFAEFRQEVLDSLAPDEGPAEGDVIEHGEEQAGGNL